MLFLPLLVDRLCLVVGGRQWPHNKRAKKKDEFTSFCIDRHYDKQQDAKPSNRRTWVANDEVSDFFQPFLVPFFVISLLSNSISVTADSWCCQLLRTSGWAPAHRRGLPTQSAVGLKRTIDPFIAGEYDMASIVTRAARKFWCIIYCHGSKHLQ